MLSAFKVLAQLKGLRGTPFDPFGRTEERRIERALIARVPRVDRGGAARARPGQPGAGGRDRAHPGDDPRLRPRQGAPPRRGAAEVGRPDGRWRAGPLALSAQALESRMAQGPDTQPLEDTTLPMTSPPALVAAIGLTPAGRLGARAPAAAAGVRPAALHPGPPAMRPVAAPWRRARCRPYSGAVNRIEPPPLPMSPPPSPADPSPPAPPARPPATGWQRFKAETVRLFHQYANWLVSISWKRFFVLVGAAADRRRHPAAPAAVQLHDRQRRRRLAHDVTSCRRCRRRRRRRPGSPSARRRRRRRRRRRASASRASRSRRRIRRAATSSSRSTATASASRRTCRSTATAFASARAPSPAARRARLGAAASAASGPRRAPRRASTIGGIEIKLPPGADSEKVREAVEEARAAVIEAIRESQEKAAEAAAGSRRRARGGGRGARLGRREGRPHRQAHARPQARRLPHRPRLADHHRVGDPEDHLQADHPGRGQGRGRDRDRRLRAAQAPGRRGAHGGDAGAGRAALPVQHAGLDRPPDRDRSAAREHDAEEPDRAAARVDAVDARVEPGAAQPRPRDGGDPALPRDPQGAHGRPPAGDRSTCPRACSRPSSRR